MCAKESEALRSIRQLLSGKLSPVGEVVLGATLDPLGTYWIQAPESATPEQVAQELEAARARIYGTEVPDDFANSPPKPSHSAPPDNLARPPHNEVPRNESVDRNL